MDYRFLYAVAAWFIPGAGHALKKEWTKAVIIAVVIWSMFVIAVWSGGAYYPGLKWEEGPLLYLLNTFARMGNVVGAFISWMVSASPAPQVAEWATYEYGGRLLEVAGLCNFLAVIEVSESESEVEAK